MNSAVGMSYETFRINYCFTQYISFSLSSFALLALSITSSSFNYVFLVITPTNFLEKHIVHTINKYILGIYTMNETIMGLILRMYVVVVIFYVLLSWYLHVTYVEWCCFLVLQMTKSTTRKS